MRSFAALLLLVALTAAEDDGVFVAELRTRAHEVKGKLYAIDEKTLLVKNFGYDGQGPDAFFWVGTSGVPSDEGHILPYPFDGKFYKYKDSDAPVLTGYFDGSKDLKLTLPDDLNVRDLKWFSVWCRQLSVNFGDLIFPDNFSLDKTTMPIVSSTVPTVSSTVPQIIKGRRQHRNRNRNRKEPRTTTSLPPPIVCPDNTLNDTHCDGDYDIVAEPEYESDYSLRHGGTANAFASSIAVVVSYIFAKFLL